MKLRGTFHTAIKALSRNPMRALLTTLGIVIGIAAVIAMMEIGKGSSAAIEKSLANMGANSFMVAPGAAASGGITFGFGSAMTLTPGDYQAIATECPAVKYVAPIVRARAQAVYGHRNWVPNQIQGSTPSFLNLKNWNEMADGECFTEHDVKIGAKVCVIGKTIARELFQGESPVGKDIRVKNISFRVVGVLPAKGADMMGTDQDDIIIAPWTTIKYRVSGSKLGNSSQSDSSSTSTLPSDIYPSGQADLYPEASSTQTADTKISVRFTTVDVILVEAISTDAIPQAISEVTQLLRERHRLRDGVPDDFNIRNFAEMSKAMKSTTAVMTNLLLCVAMISLVVGGVGIMNIMLVSVTERTREIGLRMAVGAKSNDILLQFLVESIVLCLTGGAIGILLGHGGAMLVKFVMHWPVATSPAAITAAVLVSAGVGIVFGFYPAWKASRLDPIEALRYE